MNGHRFPGWIVPLLATLVMSFSTPASAARWEPLTLWGGEVQVAAARGGSSVVYAATPAAGFYRSADDGATWQLVSRGPNRFRLQILGVDPHDPRRVYVTARDLHNDRGFFRSEDGGKHWQKSDAGIPETVTGVAFDPATPGKIYAATSTGLYRSSDRGTSWRRIAFAGKLVLRVAVAPGDPRIVLVSVQTDQDGATERSIDGGATFARVLDSAVEEYAFDPGRPGRVYGISSSLLRSDDLGATWTSLPAQSASFQTLAVTPAGTLLAGGPWERGVARSVDGGLTWRSLPGTRQAVPEDVITSLVARRDGSALSGGSRGVWKSPPDGRGWRASSTGIRGQGILSLEVAADSTLWTSAGGGVFLSGDEGESFQPRLNGQERIGFLEILAIHRRQPQVAYAFGCCAEESYGLLRTEDTGRTWELLPYTGVLRDVNVVEVDPENPDIVYAGGDLEPHASRCTAVRSTDGGANWSCITPPTQSDFTSDFTDLVIDPRDPRILYALFSGVFHRSADRGETWTIVSPRSHAIGHLTLDPSRRNRFYALSRIGPGVLRSDNGGRSWISVIPGLPEHSFVHDLLLDPARPNRVWIAVEVFETGQVGKSTSRIFRSDDAGSHWTEVSAGLAPGTVVLHLAADPRASDVVFAGTAGQGVYRLVVEE